MFQTIRNQIQSFTPSLRGFFFAAMVCGFCISAEYGVCRPTSNAFFITHFSAKWFPYAWLVSIPINFLVILLYNRLLPRLGALRLFSLIIAITSLISLACAFYIPSSPWLSFFHFVWKDVYILLMFKQLWSMIHATIPSNNAKVLYGIIFAAGGVGSIFGSMFPGFIAIYTGSEKLFFLTIPIYLLLIISYSFAHKRSGVSIGKEIFKKTSSVSVISQIFSSKYLKTVLCLVVFMQVAVAFVDYQFNFLLGQSISNVDLKTQYCGRMISLINTISTFIQLFTGIFLLPILGVKLAHKLVPSILGCNALLFLFFPYLPIASYSFVSLKSVDYSFFGLIREMLYVPLKLDEKFRVKAFIDVFVYRSSKALASLFLLLFQSFAFFSPLWMASVTLVVVFILWFYTTHQLFPAKEEKPSLNQ